MRDILHQVQIAIAINIVILAIMFVTCALVQAPPETGVTGYWSFGPSATLSVVSVTIDTTDRYCILVLFIMIMQALRTYVIETGGPLIYFNTYNADKKNIVDFTYTELYVSSLVFYATTQVRDVIFVVIAIQQIDLALWIALAGVCTTSVTVAKLLAPKEFVEPKRAAASVSTRKHEHILLYK